MKILIVTPFPAHPGSSGGATAVFNLIRQLSVSHELLYLTFARDEDAANAAKLAPYCTEIITVPFPGGEDISVPAQAAYFLRRILHNILSLLTLTPVFVWKCRARRMERAISEAVSRCKPDVVHLCFPQMAGYITACGDVPAVMDTQDVSLVSAYRKVRLAANPLARCYHFLQWLFWVRHETSYYPRYDKVLTLTRQDAAALRVFCPELDIYADAVGVDMPDIAPESAGSGCKIGFLASFGHAPNVDAALFFIRDIFPLVRKVVPDAEFVIAGRNPPAALVKAAVDGVRFAGFVEDVAQFYAGVDVVVAPLRSGGGIKIKVLEALACGRPVVATSVGAEGIAAAEEGALLVADTPERFAACVCSLLNDPELNRSLGERGRELVMRRFSWQRVNDDLSAIYAGLKRAKR